MNTIAIFVLTWIHIAQYHITECNRDISHIKIDISLSTTVDKNYENNIDNNNGTNLRSIFIPRNYKKKLFKKKYLCLKLINLLKKKHWYLNENLKINFFTEINVFIILPLKLSEN